MSFLIFLTVISILIVVHEWGHFITAKKLGVRVEQFALGFGPKLFSWIHDGTEFCLCAIPLGGYVKMTGDERSSCKGESHEFFSKSPGHRALIVLMGPVVNYLLAYICFIFVFMLGFVDMDLSAKQVESKIGQVLEGSPAQKAGLQPQDRVVQIDEKKINDWGELQEYISTSKTPPLEFVIVRGQQQLIKTITPREHKQKDIFGREHKARQVGIGPVQINSADDIVIKRYGFFGSLKKAAEELVSITTKTYVALYEMLTGIRSAKEAMGIVGMFYVIKFAASVGFSFLLHIVGVISASLAIFNLLPLIPLDGGHLFLLGIEKIRGRVLSVKIEQLISKVGFSLIITLAVFVFYADFERVGWIDKIMSLWPR